MQSAVDNEKTFGKASAQEQKRKREKRRERKRNYRERGRERVRERKGNGRRMKLSGHMTFYYYVTLQLLNHETSSRSCNMGGARGEGQTLGPECVRGSMNIGDTRDNLVLGLLIS